MAVIIEVLGWGGRRRQYYQVDADQVSIGRGYDNDIVLPDPHISANHLRLDASEDGWTITDLDSMNGLQVLKNRGKNQKQTQLKTQTTKKQQTLEDRTYKT